MKLFINSGVSHSVAMVTIDQVDPGKRSRRGKYRDGDDTFYDSHTGTNRYELNEDYWAPGLSCAGTSMHQIQSFYPGEIFSTISTSF